MENENEMQNDVSSFFNAIDRMQADMKHIMEFAEKLKMKHETDGKHFATVKDLILKYKFQNLSTYVKQIYIFIKIHCIV